MMDFLFYDGRLAWPAVAVVVYLTGLLLLCDYVWRTSKLGGKGLFLSAGVLASIGTAIILGVS
jgi:hypothetical protein